MTSVDEVQALTEAELPATLEVLNSVVFIELQFSCFTLYLKGGLNTLPFLQSVKMRAILVRSNLFLQFLLTMY